MSEKALALDSTYVIDGVQQELSPAQILSRLMDCALLELEKPENKIVDETVEDRASVCTLGEAGDIAESLRIVELCKRELPFSCITSYTKSCIASALIDTLWYRGQFGLNDLQLEASWKWNETPLGSMAAFYESVKATADYLDSLRVKLKKYSYLKTHGSSSLGFKVKVLPLCKNLFSWNPRRICPDSLVSDPYSWIIYIPFDSCDYALGGSLLYQALGYSAPPMRIEDADCFTDCYEVLRDFAEDGVLLSATTVGEGGLMTAANSMTRSGVGAKLDVSDLMRANKGRSMEQILFAELPGALIQIRDEDFDYVDAELLLQDVLYYPLGHPVPGSRKMELELSSKSGIQRILESLVQNAE